MHREPTSSPPGGGSLPAPMIDALASSRARWRDLATIGADLVFETDAAGCFVLLVAGLANDEKGSPFGWDLDSLLGRPSTEVLAVVAGVTTFNPFLAPVRLRRHRTWLRSGDGRMANVLVSAMPLHDDEGNPTGTRGIIQDVTEIDRRDAGRASTLLRHQTLKDIGRRMRQTVLPDMVIRIGLGELLDATGADGAAIMACDGAFLEPGDQTNAVSPMPRILHRAGSAAPAPDPNLLSLACRATGLSAAPWTSSEVHFDTRMILCAISTHFCDPVVLALWRDPSNQWVAGDAELAAEFLGMIGGVLEHDQVQRELARQSGADALTSLLNRESFTAEVNRRLDRLDSEGLPATLMVVGLDAFGTVNEAHGHERGDAVLRQVAGLLRDAVRPTDLVSRLGGDVFALWLDGADQFASAERAETMCQRGVLVSLEGQPRLSISIGVACRPSRSYETVGGLLEQAGAALRAVKLAGGGRWHFYNEAIGS